MPVPDPLPTPSAAARRRFWRAVRLIGAFAAIVAILSAIIVARGQDDVRIHMLVATALGTGLTVLVGGALMTLVFLSAESGHDDAAGKPFDSESDE